MNQIKNISDYPGLPTSFPARATTSQGGGFQEILTSFVKQVDQQLKDSDQKAVDFATGKNYDLHEIMIASEKAGLSFSLLMQIRNKLLEAYTEIMRMSF
jgi:flagellar hook-basal body complex protein FliE